MSLTDLERLRLAISDRYRLVLREDVGVGDGTTKQFILQLVPVLDASETVLVNGSPVATYTLDNDTGLLEFTAAPAVNAELLVTYKWSVFGDDELNDLLIEQGMTVRDAAIRAIDWLLADRQLFMRYTIGQQTVDRTAARAGLLDLRKNLAESTSNSVFSIVKADSAARRLLLEPFMREDAATGPATS